MSIFFRLEVLWHCANQREHGEVLPHSKIQKYIRSFTSFHGINSNDQNPSVAYNTRVEKVEKRYNKSGVEAGWQLTLKEIVPMGNNLSRARWTKEVYHGSSWFE